MRVGEAKAHVVEKIIEKEVVKEVKVGISEEEFEAAQRAAEAKNKMLVDQARNDMQELLKTNEQTAQQLAQRLAQEKESKRKHEVLLNTAMIEMTIDAFIT